MSIDQGRVCIIKIENFKELKRLRKNVRYWDFYKERFGLLYELDSLISGWKGPLPNLRDIFKPKEIDQLLLDSVNSLNKYSIDEHDSKRARFIEFVARCGYKDEPIVGFKGKPLSHRTTAIHRTLLTGLKNEVTRKLLFKIYDRCDVNYIDLKTGITHFHVACAYGYVDIVEKFLKLGQDPNCLLARSHSSLSPLHLAIFRRDGDLVQLLLRKGADPNIRDIDGWTPLHILALRENDDELARLFLETCVDIKRPVQVDARDRLGQTPLQSAVAGLRIDMVDVLLDHGADLSSFVFPPVSYFGEKLKPMPYEGHMFKLRLASSVLFIVEELEERGYELDRSDAITIMKTFVEYESCEMFEDSDQRPYSWYDNEEFVNKSKEIMMHSSLSLYDLIRLRPEEAEKSLTYADYLITVLLDELSGLPELDKKACAEHLCEKLARGIFRSWALDSFLELTNYRFPILCCEMIIDNLKNKDLLNVCLGKTDIEPSQKIEISIQFSENFTEQSSKRFYGDLENIKMKVAIELFGEIFSGSSRKLD